MDQRRRRQFDDLARSIQHGITEISRLLCSSPHRRQHEGQWSDLLGTMIEAGNVLHNLLVEEVRADDRAAAASAPCPDAGVRSSPPVLPP